MAVPPGQAIVRMCGAAPPTASASASAARQRRGRADVVQGDVPAGGAPAPARNPVGSIDVETAMPASVIFPARLEQLSAETQSAPPP